VENRRAYKGIQKYHSQLSTGGTDQMREVGKVVSRFKRFIICQSSEKARIYLGDPVYSRQGKEVGTVIDVFGPVKRPYLKILKKNGKDVSTLYVR
jgi:rRNA processing protein Gar1